MYSLLLYVICDILIPKCLFVCASLSTCCAYFGAAKLRLSSTYRWNWGSWCVVVVVYSVPEGPTRNWAICTSPLFSGVGCSLQCLFWGLALISLPHPFKREKMCVGVHVVCVWRATGVLSHFLRRLMVCHPYLLVCTAALLPTSALCREQSLNAGVASTSCTMCAVCVAICVCTHNILCRAQIVGTRSTPHSLPDLVEPGAATYM